MQNFLKNGTEICLKNEKKVKKNFMTENKSCNKRDTNSSEMEKNEINVR